MSDFDLSVGVAGVDQAVQAMSRLGGATQAVGQQAAQVGTTASAASASTVAWASSSQQAASRIQGLAGQVQALSGRLGGGAIGQAAGLVGSLAGVTAQSLAMGATMGPAGMVVGAVTGLIPLIEQLATQNRDAATEARDHEEALRGLSTAMLEQREIQRRSADIAAGVFGADLSDRQLTQERETRRQQALEIDNELGHLRDRLQRSSGSVARAVQESIEEQTQRLGALRQEIAGIDAEVDRRSQSEAESAETNRRIATSTGDAADAGERHARAAAHAAAAARDHADAIRDAAAAEQAFLQEMMEASRVGREQAANERSMAAATARDHARWGVYRAAPREADGSVSLPEAASTDSIAQLANAHDQQASSMERATRAQIGLTRAQAAARDQSASVNSATRSVADMVGGTMTSALSSAVSAWVDGSASFVDAAEAMAKGVIKSLVEMSIVQTIVETARGIADLANRQYDTAVQHFVAAAEFAAVGVVAGGIGAGIGAFGGGGAGAAKGGGGASTRDMANASSEAQRNQGAGGTMVLNVYPGGYITQRDVQAGILDALDRAARDGMRINPRLLGGATVQR